MIYIDHIDQILEAIKDNTFFSVVKKNGYTVANYIAQSDETFPALDPSLPKDEYNRRMILRECRGIMFDDNGKVIRRPFQKFLNYGQNILETSLVDFSKPHHILRKYDGSNISPFMLNGKIEYGTKMGITDVCKPVYKFVEKNTHIRDISMYLVTNNYTPCFEWCSNKQRIVLDYPIDDMVLTGVRHMNTGEYMPYDEMVQLGEMFGVHVTESFGQVHNIEQFVEDVNNLKNEEGFVVRWDDGFSQKFKSMEYLELHRVASDISAERAVISFILNDKVDDIAPKMKEDVREKFLKFHNDVIKVIIEHVADVKTVVEQNQHLTMIEFVEKYNKQFGHLEHVYFSTFRNYSGDFDTERVMKGIIDTMKKHLYRKHQIEENRYLLKGLVWDYHWFGDNDA